MSFSELSGATLRSNRPKSVGEILARLLQKTALGTRLEQARIWEQWPEVAGPVLCEHGRPRAVRDKTLIVEVDSTVWMNRFAYSKWDLLKRVNLAARKELISDIFLVLTPDTEPTPHWTDSTE
jgi:predicted nucleic acid-binding Zn ribbon protein